MIKKVKWYRTKWFYATIVIAVTVGLTYFGASTDAYGNFRELFKSDIKSKEIQKDSLVKNHTKIDIKREKIKVSRDKILTTEETKRIEYLEQELANLRKFIATDTMVKKDSPEELFRYFNSIK